GISGSESLGETSCAKTAEAKAMEATVRVLSISWKRSGTCGIFQAAFKDSAVSGYARNVVRENPETAIEWASSIGSPDL
ncbi:MAG: hypothetical protein QNL24_09635, partial [Akkermansiaceae bacterium]